MSRLVMPGNSPINKYIKLTLLGKNVFSIGIEAIKILKQKYDIKFDVEQDFQTEENLLYRGLSGKELYAVLTDKGGRFGWLPKYDSSFVNLAEYAQINTNQLVSFTKSSKAAYNYAKIPSSLPGLKAVIGTYSSLVTVDLAYFAKMNQKAFESSYAQSDEGLENLDPQLGKTMDFINNQDEVCVVPRLHGVDLRSDLGYLRKAYLVASAGTLEKIVPSMQPGIVPIDGQNQIVLTNDKVSIHPINLQVIYAHSEELIEDNSQKALEDGVIEDNMRLLTVDDISQELLEMIHQLGRFSPSSEDEDFQLQLNSVPQDLKVGDVTDYIIETYKQHLNDLQLVNDVSCYK